MKKMSKALLARIKFRYEEYFVDEVAKSKAKVQKNAMKMAHNWKHEYPTGTPLEYIRDDIIECWERNDSNPREETPTVTPIVTPEQRVTRERLIPKWTPTYTPVDVLDE
jgi:hypothetical protein